MPEFVKVMKLHIHADKNMGEKFLALSNEYKDACNFVSEYIFNNDCILEYYTIQKALYKTLRTEFKLKSQMALSVIKTVIARYHTVETQFKNSPYKYVDENKKVHYIERNLEWLQKPINFKKPQVDLISNRDYSFVDNKNLLSINTLEKREKVTFDIPDCFASYFDGTWKFGIAKLVFLKNEWYMHISMTTENTKVFDKEKPSHVVGIDRGLRFLATAYDEKGETTFFDGKKAMQKRDKFAKTRAELQSKGTKSAKKVLKRISGRENRWMSDVNHQISKTLIEKYGENTLFVIEDLTGVTFNEQNLESCKDNRDRMQLRSWAFYQLETFLTYKAAEQGSYVLKVPAEYTSQRCPKCGRIHKENRNHKTHEYKCDSCGYTSNDDRIAAMNIYTLGTMYISGDTNPRYGPRKVD